MVIWSNSSKLSRVIPDLQHMGVTEMGSWRSGSGRPTVSKGADRKEAMSEDRKWVAHLQDILCPTDVGANAFLDFQRSRIRPLS